MKTKPNWEDNDLFLWLKPQSSPKLQKSNIDYGYLWCTERIACLAMFLSTCDCYSRTAYGVTCYIYVAKILFDVMWQNRGIEKPVLTRNQMQGPWFEPAVLYNNHPTTNHSQSYIAQLILNVPISIFTHRLSQSYICMESLIIKAAQRNMATRK